MGCPLTVTNDTGSDLPKALLADFSARPELHEDGQEVPPDGSTPMLGDAPPTANPGPGRRGQSSTTAPEPPNAPPGGDGDGQAPPSVSADCTQSSPRPVNPTALRDFLQGFKPTLISDSDSPESEAGEDTSEMTRYDYDSADE
jgi:hypothetical protein